MKKKRLITSALPYVNNIPHLGNIIGCVLSADVYYRYCKTAGYDARFVCGTDEYGTTTETRAREENVSPQELCDKYYAIHKEVYEWFNIDFSVFGRSSGPRQIEIVQDMFKKLYNAGYIVKDTLVQPYCSHCDLFLADRYITGICPHCGFEEAKGDQCDNCGKLLEPKELESPQCTVCHNHPEFTETKHLFLDLEKLGPKLEEWTMETAAKNNWSHNAVQVTKGWLEQGLKKRCITRDLKWGVNVPLEGYEDKVFYVWFDAPIGYISITAGKFDDWESWWKNPDEVELFQFMGKDNIPFHTVLFPASLIGSGDNWTLLKTISSTEYLNYENVKFSKSRGTGVFGDQAKQTGIDADLFRYYLLRNRPEKNDTRFYWTDFLEKVNGEIIANYSNLVNRVTQFIHKNFDGVIPEIDKTFFDSIDFKAKVDNIIDEFEKLELKKALLSILDLCSDGNKYFQDSEPWVVIKEDREKCASIVGTLCAFIKDISILLYPYIPAAAERCFAMLGLDKKQIDTSLIGDYSGLVGNKIDQPVMLFKKLDKKLIDSLRAQFGGGEEEKKGQEKKKSKKDKKKSKGLNPADDKRTPAQIFSSLSLKVGKIIEIERHPEADKLYIEKVDMGGGEIRQIVSGLVPYYAEDQLLGKKVIIVCNLKPAKLRGTMSEGMLLAAEPKDRSVVEVLHPECEIGEAVTMDGSVEASSTTQITIDDFMLHSLDVQDFQASFKGSKLTAGGKELKFTKVENGLIR